MNVANEGEGNNSRSRSPSYTAMSDFLAELASEIDILRERALEYTALENRLYTEERECLAEIARKKKALLSLQPPTATDGANRLEESALLAEQERRALLNELKSISSIFPRPQPFLCKASLGTASFALKSREKIAYKEDYERFKLKMTVLSLFLSLFCLFFPNKLLDALFSFVLLYSYSSQVLREHVLWINGSNIRTWWIAHHYLSILLAGIVLIWPTRSSCFPLFRSQMHIFAIYLSVVQLLQFRYQMSRLYTLRALSKASPMDTTTDAAAISNIVSLATLVPFLIIGHIFQLYNAWALWDISLIADCVEWQPIAAALLFAAIGVGNFVTTLRTLLSRKYNAKNKST